MSRINNYQELVAERIRLQEQLQRQKAVLKTEMNKIKTRLEPFTDFVSFLGIFKQKEEGSSSLLKTGMSVGIDLLGSKLMTGTNWITRFVVPFIVKGIASRLLIKKENQ